MPGHVLKNFGPVTDGYALFVSGSCQCMASKCMTEDGGWCT